MDPADPTTLEQTVDGVAPWRGPAVVESPAAVRTFVAREIDGYSLQSEIGRGTMGAVYLARDTVLERPVALKFIEGLGEVAEARERFRTEAKAVARVQHPNVVSIYRVGEHEGRPYIVSEFVRGRSLDALPLPLSAEELLKVGVQLSRGLDAAHRRGVLHRDIKPANVLLSDAGEVKLVDFGLAKLVEPGDARFAQREAEFLGTPLYMAPEVWSGDGTTFRSDVYSAGALLYHLAAGRTPFTQPNLTELGAAVMAGNPPRLEQLARIDPRLAAVIHRCLSVDPRARYGHGGELREALEALTQERRAWAIPEGNPYRGLQAFQSEHRDLFFGRDPDIGAVVERLRTDAFVLVAGASGIGKSSLCRAGVVPRIAEGALGGGVRLQVVAITPGRHPVNALAGALAPLLEEDEAELGARIRDDATALLRQLRRRTKDGNAVLVFVDQLEELVTLSEPEEALAFAALLEALVQQAPGLRVLATVRGDFISRVGSLGGLSDPVSRALYLLRPLGEGGIRQAILGPAEASGLGFESDVLVQALVHAAGAEGALPLLQFTLAQLWDRRDQARNLIPTAALQSLGGVEGALARHADGVLAGLSEGERTAVRRILLRLVTLEDTRARRTEDELLGLHPNAAAALQALLRGRLLLVSEGADGFAYEVAHEALIGSWPTLRRWLDGAKESRAQRERLSAAVSDWRRGRESAELLWRRGQLDGVAQLDRDELLPAERSFLERSARAAQRGRILRWSAALMLLTLICAGYAFVRTQAQNELRDRVEALLNRGRQGLGQARALTEHGEAVRLRAFAAFDSDRKEQAEGLWSEWQQVDHEVDAKLAAAGQSLESALSLDPSSPAARSLLADVLFERAQAADRARRPSARNELLGRLTVYDDAHAREHRLHAPGVLSVSSQPVGAEVTLARYLPAANGSRVLDEAQALGRTPVEEHELEAGSYLLTLRSAGRPEVRLPVLIAPGQQRQVKVPVPAHLPTGFAFVPEGAFLFGSTAEDSLRRDFFYAAPVHELQGGAFLISRTETTFGEWIAWLNALSPGDAELRRPRVEGGGFRGGLSLDRVGGRWQLRWKLSGAELLAAEGEPLRLAGRSAPLDWSRIPVTGVTLDDARQYTRWLDQSGRVPGARLCTEAEWERAARGADDREFPNGDRLNPADANFDETYRMRPDAIGPDEVSSHPASRSPFGVDDLAGNVWEWTTPVIGTDPVARGGSFHYGITSVRSTNREVVEPGLRDASVGLRVCADLPAEH